MAAASEFMQNPDDKHIQLSDYQKQPAATFLDQYEAVEAAVYKGYVSTTNQKIAELGNLLKLVRIYDDATEEQQLAIREHIEDQYTLADKTLTEKTSTYGSIVTVALKFPREAYIIHSRLRAVEYLKKSTMLLDAGKITIEKLIADAGGIDAIKRGKTKTQVATAADKQRAVEDARAKIRGKLVTVQGKIAVPASVINEESCTAKLAANRQYTAIVNINADGSLVIDAVIDNDGLLGRALDTYAAINK